MTSVTGIDRHPRATLMELRNAGIAIVAFAVPCLIGSPTPYLLLILTIVGYASPTLRRSFRERSRNPVDALFLIAVLALAAAFTIDAKAPTELKYIANFLPLLVALPLRWQLEERPRADGIAILATLCLIGAGLAVLVGAFQSLVLRLPRAGDRWLNSILFADAAMLLGFLALAGCFAPGVRRRWIFLFGPMLGTIAAVLAGTRGALLAIPVLGLLAFIFAIRRGGNRTLVVVTSAVALCACLAIVILPSQFATRGSLLGRAATLFSAVDTTGKGELAFSTQVRLNFAAAGWQAALDAPLLGHGWARMVSSALPYLPAEMRERYGRFGHLHNDFLNAVVSAGIVGFASYLLLLVAPLAGVLNSPRDSQFSGRLYMALALSLGYAVFGLTNVAFGYEFLTVLYGTMLAVILGIARDPKKRDAVTTAA